MYIIFAKILNNFPGHLCKRCAMQGNLRQIVHVVGGQNQRFNTGKSIFHT